MATIAILGYGTVGSGVARVLETNRAIIDKKAAEPIRIKYILDLRDFPDNPLQSLMTKDFNNILNDDEVSVVVETMGGVEPAYTYIKNALLKGKSCVTSNKELVAKHGAELLAIAKEKNINFLFEASVGGGIPIIRPLNQSLTADEIFEIRGILNGTTNFILTKMSKEGLDFATVLKEAQDLGYAERDPSADVEGHDACRKIAILLSLAMGQQADYNDIYTEGITKLTTTDFEYAKKLNYSIKLLAKAELTNEGVYAIVSPALISSTHALAFVNDVFNAIFIKGNVTDEVMFYGRGAGQLPTASAVVADVVDCVKHKNRNVMHFWSQEKLEMLPIETVPVKMFVRVACDESGKEKAKEEINALFNNPKTIELDNVEGEFAFITEKMPLKATGEKLSSLKEAKVLSKIRLGE